MDRNVGALSTGQVAAVSGNVVYFQFGRNIPIAHPNRLATMYLMGSVKITAADYAAIASPTVAVPMATLITNPKQMYAVGGNTLCSENVGNNLLDFDPNVPGCGQRNL